MYSNISSSSEISLDVSDDTLFKLAKIAKENCVKRNTVLLITNNIDHWKNWNQSPLAEFCELHLCPSPHRLLCSGEFQFHRLFILIGGTIQCSSESLKDLLKKRVSSPFEVMVKPSHPNQEIIEDILKSLAEIELKFNAEETAKHYWKSKSLGSLSPNHFSPRQDNLVYEKNKDSVIKRYTRHALQQKLVKILSDSPEKYLEMAIKGIKKGDSFSKLKQR